MFEFLLEIIVEVVLSGLFDLGGRGVSRVSRSRRARLGIVMGVLVAGGLVAGYLWGYHAAARLDGATPRSLWISLATGVIAFVLAAGLHRSADQRFAASPGREPRSWSRRLVTIGALNLVAAAGIAWGAASV